jgi:hypothetical protein
MRDFPFDDAPNVAAITTSNVLNGDPILLVTHDDDDGSWQFLCGKTNNPDDGRIVGLECIFEQDPSVGELADLPRGWAASRTSVRAPWFRYENPAQPA